LRIPKNIKTIPPERAPMPHQPAEARVHNFNEFRSAWIWMARSTRPNAACAVRSRAAFPGCPVGIDIPGFISALARKDVEQSYRILKSSNALPAVCGRVCPQESQCEATCVVGSSSSRWRSAAWSASSPMPAWVADGTRRRRPQSRRPSARPSSAAVRRDWLAPESWRGRGVSVTIFEALHVAGGVLKYGIPEFRLPDIIIDAEIENLKKMGVEIKLDTIIGKLFTIPQLLGEMGFQTRSWGRALGRRSSPAFPARPITASFPPMNSHAGQPDARAPSAALRHSGRAWENASQ
jgi:glutamate synthase (NADPH/NADH) small chain